MGAWDAGSLQRSGTDRHRSSSLGRGLVVIPTYNESENLSRLVSLILEQAPGLDVLVVDDHSPDGTGEIADQLTAADSRVNVIHRESKLGLATAYLAGFRFALARPYEYVIQMDADFSHRVEDLPKLVDAAASADVTIGSRDVAGGQAVDRSLLRRAISGIGSTYARLLLGLPVRDCTGGYKCFRRAALLRLDLDRIESRGYAFQVEVNYLCHRAGLKLVEVPIIFPDRAAGTSKMTTRILLEAWLVVLRLRLDRLGTRLRGLPLGLHEIGPSKGKPAK